jgi:hypothetical protein
MHENLVPGAPTDDELHALLHTVIARLMKMLTRRGVLIEEMGHTWLADPSPGVDGAEARTLRLLQAAAIIYRIAFGPRWRTRAWRVSFCVPTPTGPAQRRRPGGTQAQDTMARRPVRNLAAICHNGLA